MRRTLLVIFAISLLMASVPTHASSESALAVESLSATTLHDPIVILSDEEFTAKNGVVGGSGTYEDPFVIEGWEIDLSDEPQPESGMMLAGINIQNTYSWFVVRNVYVHSGNQSSPSPAPGVVCYNVHQAEITDSIISGNANGLHLLTCGGIEVRGCAITNNTIGMMVDACSNLNVVNNTISWNDLLNVDMTRVMNSKIVGNDLSHTGDWTSIGLYMCEECDLNNNTISHNPALGLNLGFCEDCEVTYNAISDNRVGINMYGSEDMVIEDNSFSGNEDDREGQGGDDGSSVSFTIAMVVAAVLVTFVVVYMLGMRKNKPEQPTPPPGPH